MLNGSKRRIKAGFHGLGALQKVLRFQRDPFFGPYAMVSSGIFTGTGGRFAPCGCQYRHQCYLSIPPPAGAGRC